jgi:hypothetical protein
MEHGHIVPREPRLPLFVQVTTEPPLPDCGSVNLSRSGIGLVTAAGIESEVGEGGWQAMTQRLDPAERAMGWLGSSRTG